MEAMAANTMDREAFHKTQSYLALTEKQKVWVDTFCESHDAAHSTRIAYGSDTSEEYRAMLTRKIETSARVVAALDLYYGRSPREKFIRDLELNIANSTGIAKVEGQKLLAKVLGLVNDESSPNGKIGDTVLVEGKRFTVTAVDENGRPTDGEPL
jgi:hypothetical protein